MTENEIRQQVVGTVVGWLGLKSSDQSHKPIIDLYNSHLPHPRGYKMTLQADWCAATVSAVAIQLGLTDIMPVECSCSEMVKLYQKLGRWVEDDAYTPRIGDVIFYSWKDNGVGDNILAPNHVGIVTDVKGSSITVTEGNMGAGIVGMRTLQINGRYIRGFGIPDYASKADKPQSAPWYAKDWARATEMGLVDGTRPEDPVTRAEVATIVLRAIDAR